MIKKRNNACNRLTMQGVVRNLPISSLFLANPAYRLHGFCVSQDAGGNRQRRESGRESQRAEVHGGTVRKQSRAQLLQQQNRQVL